MSLPEENPGVNFLGMGMPELVLVFGIAFLALGPAKSLEMARTASKFFRDMRGTFHDVIAATKLDPPAQRREENTPPKPPDSAPSQPDNENSSQGE